MYILLEVGYQYSVNGYSPSFFYFSSLSLRASLLIYTTSPSTSLPSTWTVD